MKNKARIKNKDQMEIKAKKASKVRATLRRMLMPYHFPRAKMA
jgi:hypothetical protein